VVLGLTVGMCTLACFAAIGITNLWAICGVLAAGMLLVAGGARMLLPSADAAAGAAPPHDALTGLPNRAMMMAQVERTLPVADADQEPAGLVILDLNDLADVNDTLGERVGDLLLRSVAARLSAAVRDTDMVARIGGDEFAVLLPRVGSAAACLETARRLVEAVQGPADLDGFRVRINAAAGGAVYPVHAATPTELFQRAETTMRYAKHARTHAALYEPGMEGELAPRGSYSEIPARAGQAALPRS
jgi:diguanylate cyclase (GGDEF)-like protein